MRLLFAFAAICSMSSLSTLCAQEIQVDPKNWFPLEIDSFWHYETITGVPATIIRKAEKDTLVDNERWVLIRDVDCSISHPCSNSEWYRVSEDNYVLISRDLGVSPADTLLPTIPQSILLSRAPADRSTIVLDSLQSTETGETVRVGVSQTDQGNVADSTQFLLSAGGDSSGIFLFEEFVYKIGRSRFLVGAIVDGIRYGDTRKIDDVISVNTEGLPDLPEPSLDISIQLFPNPSKGRLTVKLHPPIPGVYTFSIANSLGQEVKRSSFFMDMSLSTRIDLSQEINGLSAGAYYLIIRSNKQAITTPFVITN